MSTLQTGHHELVAGIQAQPTEAQRQRDQQIRLEQAQARRCADDALKAHGRLWSSGPELEARIDSLERDSTPHC